MSDHTHASVNSVLRAFFKRGSQIGLGLGAVAPVLALANPTGGQVVSGTATITTPSSNGMVIKQSTASAIIDWQQFNIGTGQYVQFLQPSSSSVVLNRVIGGGSSSILGSLTGNGQIFLVNTNGVYFGKGASVDAQGFLASTLDISDSDFLARNFIFNKSGSDAQIVNQGNITAHKGGYVVLAGDYAENDGLIAAQSGHIVLASGTKSTLTLNGNSFVSYAVSQATLSQLAGVKNAGDLEANGGTVIMTADVANLLKATVVNNTGLIEAHGISNKGGVIQLTATGGNITNAGLLDASATTLGQQGGDITLKTDGRTTLTSRSRIIDVGDGANGGNLEVSGSTISVRGTALLGKGGHMLLDPGTMEIVATSAASSVNNPGNASNNTSIGHIGVNFIQKTLNAGTQVTIQATHLIDASAGVKVIAAKGSGELSLKTTATGSKIQLSGVDITIGGLLDASLGFDGTGSFGFIQAGSVSVHAAIANIKTPNAVVAKNGSVTRYSIKATKGSIDFSHGTLVGNSTHGTIALDAAVQTKIGEFANGSGSAGLGNLLLVGAFVQAEDIDAKGIVTIEATAKTGVASLLNGGIFLNGVTGEKGITLTATDGVNARDLTAYGGNITVTTLAGSGGVGLGAVTASDGNINIKGGSFGVAAKLLDAGGSITVIAKQGGFTLDSSHGFGSQHVAIHAGKSVSVTADHIQDASGTAAFVISVGANLKLGGPLEGVSALPVTLKSGGMITLNHGIVTTQSIDIQGKQLAYSGSAGVFSLSAGKTLVVDASIGTTKAPDKYAVALHAGGAMTLERSIIVTGGITAAAAGSLDIGDSDKTKIIISGKSAFLQGHGVTIGGQGSDSITAKGAIDISGGSGSSGLVKILGFGKINISADDANAKTSTDDLSINGGRVLIGGASGSVAGATVNRSVTLHAGHDVKISASHGATLQPGRATANANGLAAASLLTDLTVTAGHDIDVDGGTSVTVAANNAEAEIFGNAKAAATATANTSVTLKAGHDVILSGTTSVDISGGPAFVDESTHEKKQALTATVTSGVSITAGSDFAVYGGAITIHGGSNVGLNAVVEASNSSAKAAATLHANVAITGGHDIELDGTRLIVHGGDDLGGPSHFLHGNSVSGASGVLATTVTASGKKASTTFTATADVTLTAGAGGISGHSNGLTVLRGGDSAGLAMDASAAGAAAKLSVDLESAVSLVSKGGISFKSSSLQVRGGNGAFEPGVDSTHSPGGSGSNQVSATVDADGAGAAASVKVASGVKMKAAGAVALSGAVTEISAGESVAKAVRVETGSSAAAAKASLTADASVSITAGKTLDIKTDAGSGAGLFGGYSAASHAQVLGRQGSATLTITDGLTLSGTKGILVSDAIGTSGHISLHGGNGAGQFAKVESSDGGKSALSAVTGVSLAATAGSIAFTAPDGNLALNGASYGGRAADIKASHGGSAALTGNGAVSLKASKKIGVNVLGAVVVRGGAYDGDALLAAAGAGAKAGLILNDSIGITAASASFHDGAFDATAGSHDAWEAQATASSGATANLKTVSHVDLVVTHDLSITGSFVSLLPGRISEASHAVLKAKGATNVADLSLDDGFTIQAGGNITLDTGTGTLNVGGVQGAAQGLFASAASGGGVIKVGLMQGVTLAAKGTLTLEGGSINVLSETGVGSLMDVFAAQGKSKATVGVDSAVSLSGASVTITASQSVNLQVNDAAAHSMELVAEGIKSVITATVEDDLSVTATGALNITTGSGKDLSIGKVGSTSLGVGSQAVITAELGGAVTATTTANTTLKGGSVSLTAGTTKIGAGEQVGKSADINATQGTVAFTAERSVTVQATGALTVAGKLWLDYDGSSASIHGGASAGAAVQLTVAGSTAKLAYTAQSAVNLTGGTITQTGASFQVHTGIDVAESFKAGVAGGSLAYVADSQITIASKGNLTLTEQGALFLAVSGAFGAHDSGNISAGKAAITVDAGIALTAVKNLSIDLGNHSLGLIDLGAGGLSGPSASHALVTANKGSTKYTLGGSVLVQADSKLSLSSIDAMVAGNESAAPLTTFTNDSTSKTVAVIDESVSILGKTLSVLNLGPVGGNIFFAGNSFASGGVTFKGKLNFTTGIPLGFAPEGVKLGTLQRDGLNLNLETVLSMPGQAAEPTLFTPATSLQTGSAGCGAKLVKQDGHCLLKD